MKLPNLLQVLVGVTNKVSNGFNGVNSISCATISGTTTVSKYPSTHAQTLSDTFYGAPYRSELAGRSSDRGHVARGFSQGPDKLTGIPEAMQVPMSLYGVAIKDGSGKVHLWLMSRMLFYASFNTF
jgi:hypothetical protein